MEHYQTPTLWRRAENCPVLHPEAVKDCILPDSYPDIHRILQVTATVSPGRLTLSAGKLRAEGILHTAVLFADEDGAVHTVRFALDYAGQMPYSTDDAEMTSVADTVLESVAARVQNPRKLAIRGRICVTPCLFLRCDDEPVTSPELTNVTLEKKMQTVPYWQMKQWCENGIEASEDLSLGQEPSISRIVWSDLQLEITSCQAEEGELRFSGNGTLHLFYVTPQNRVQYAGISFPIRSSLQGEIPSEALCRVALIPEEVTVLPVEDSAGEVRGVELDFTYSVCATAAWKVNCTRPVDCYSVEAATAVRMEKAVLLSSVKELSREFYAAVDAEAAGMRSVLHATATVTAEAREETDEGAQLRCCAQITVIGTDAEDALMSVPLTEHFSIPLEEGDLCFCRMTAEPTVQSEGETLKVRLSGKLSGMAAGWGELTYVGGVLPSTDPLSCEGDTFTLCYPASGETLWDIAKRYRIPQSAILRANSISEEALPVVLLIPH